MFGLEGFFLQFNLEEQMEGLALGGVVGGTVIGVIMKLVDVYFERRSEIRLGRQKIVDMYLLQLQDAIEDLLERFEAPYPSRGEKIDDKAIQEIKDKNTDKTADEVNKLVEKYHVELDYYKSTMLYALARIFAFKRILIEDAVYTQMRYIKKNLGNKVKSILQEIDDILVEIDKVDEVRELYDYDNIALGELVVDTSSDHMKTVTYVAFKEKYDDPPDFLERAKGFPNDFQDEMAKKPFGELKNTLRKFGEICQDNTSIKLDKKDKKAREKRAAARTSM